MIKNQETDECGLVAFNKEQLVQEAETEIREARKTIDYNTVEFKLEYFIDKISQQEIDDNLHWNEEKQSYFIESLMLGLPILAIVFKEKNSNDWDKLNSIEQIIDGKQRLLTALNFINNNLQLSNLKQLETLNGFKFEDLMLSRQSKFKRISVRAFAVAPKSDLSVWREYR
ncbi:hypothetical protein NIES4102_41530 (plasmid) [Chondrocystis sp. NIES-4102]|nr:hypothetical protein NIES4102_41530 [Chondrocystis sp. NIES-4102]